MSEISKAEQPLADVESRPAYYSGDFFDGLEAEKRAFIEQAVPRKVKKGEYVYSEGEVSHSVFYIQEGDIRLYRTDLEGKDLSYAINSKGGLIGISASLHGNRRLVHAQAIINCRLYELGIDKFREMIRMYPRLSERVIVVLVKRVSYLIDNYLSAMCDTAVSRLSKFLAYNYYMTLLEMKEKKLSESSPQVINQSDLATYLGITRQRTNELLHNLDGDRVIRVQRNKIVFLKPDYLLNFI